MSVEEVKRLFPDEEFAEAAGVLEMISKTPEQQMQYDARRKLQMDEAARLEYARDEGLQEGLQKSALFGRITLLQELLGISEPAPGELSRYDEGRLSQLAEQLQSQLRTRGQSQS